MMNIPIDLKTRVIFSYIRQGSSDSPSDFLYEQKGSRIDITDSIGGRAYIELKNGIAHIIDIKSVPRDKAYSPEEDNFKRRGFFKGILKELRDHGIRSIHISLQSQDTRKALKRMVETGILKNPRDMAGISIDEYPTTFDIQEVLLCKKL